MCNDIQFWRLSFKWWSIFKPRLTCHLLHAKICLLFNLSCTLYVILASLFISWWAQWCDCLLLLPEALSSCCSGSGLRPWFPWQLPVRSGPVAFFSFYQCPLQLSWRQTVTYGLWYLTCDWPVEILLEDLMITKKSLREHFKRLIFLVLKK